MDKLGENMTIAEYQQLAIKTDRHRGKTDPNSLLVSALGLVGEVGSLAAVYKKNGYVSNIAREFVNSFGCQNGLL